MFDKLKSVGKNLKRELEVYRLVIKDSRTPALSRLLLGLAVGYALLPFDIIPDFIPVIGHLDDVIIVPALVVLALKITPKEVIEDCRAKVNASEADTTCSGPKARPPTKGRYPGASS